MQKFSARPLLLSAGWLALSAFCFGDTVTVASSAGETMNSSGMPTLAVNPVDPLWAPALAGSSWVSYVNSGNPAMPNFVSPPNGTSVIFTDTFDINGTPSSGTLNVFADDSASVTLNGILLMPLASASGNTYKVCSDSPIGCLSNTGAIVNLTSALLPGINTLSFDVVQEAGVAYGLDYAGTINYSMPAVITATPEPATFALLGLPLAALFAWRRRRA
jgi:hypothetical protein